jgi:AcrR family transcriptional regulator|tara:strand:- start:746 stop:1426 length:681 start_codon:yes stop_codon:yes gene_type:complete
MSSLDENKNQVKVRRRVQERTEIARSKLIEAATPMFAEQGFDAISVRDIENAAGVKRGVLSYHFGTKDELWREATNALFNPLITALGQRLEILRDLSSRERVALLIRFHVRYYAENPLLSRLMSQEARQNTWRIAYLSQHYVGPSVAEVKKHIADELELTQIEFAHWYYIMVSASATIFSFESECEKLFGFNPRTEEAIERHANMLVAMLLKPVSAKSRNKENNDE